MANKRVSSEERESLIIAELSLLIQEGKEPELTAYNLASRMDMWVSKSLYATLARMVDTGKLETRWESLGNRGGRKYYRLAEGMYKLPDRTRSITMRMGGKIYQEVLF